MLVVPRAHHAADPAEAVDLRALRDEPWLAAPAGESSRQAVDRLLAAVATALLVGPVAYHRMVFRRGQKERLVRAASVMAIGGLAAVALAVSAAVLLVTSYVGGGLAAGLISAFVALMFGVLWFAFPLTRRREP